MPAREHICASSRLEGSSFVLLCIIKIGSFPWDQCGAFACMRNGTLQLPVNLGTFFIIPLFARKRNGKIAPSCWENGRICKKA
jgi:hypothetical protein